MALRRIAMVAVLVWATPALVPGATRAAAQKSASQKSGPTAKPRPTPTPKSSKAGSKAPAKSAKPKAAPTPPPAKPDRSLYQAAEKAEKSLRSSTRLMAKKAEWEKVASAYRVVVGRYPRSPYCDDALLNAGDLQREMSERFNNRRYSDQALESYALIVEEYPGSSLGEAALFATYEILTGRGQKAGAREAAEKYLAAYPDGKRAKALAQAMAASRPERTARAAEKASSAPPPSGGSQFERTGAPSTGHVQIFGVRFWSGEASTRVVIDLDRKVEITQSRLQDPPRLFVDLVGTRLHPNLVGKTFPVGNAFLKQIRIGVNRENVVRVVIDFGEASSHNVFFLADPQRLVIDVRGAGPAAVRMAGSDPRPGPASTPASGSSPSEVVMESVQVTQPAPVLPEIEDEGDEEARPGSSSPPPPQPTPLEAPAPAPSARPAMPPASLPMPEATATPPPPAPPAQATSGTPTKNRDGSYSLARQLGLGARRIALDAGHGGHDPGAIGRGGTQEKDITLAIVLKLEKLLRTELGADVVMTRDTDVFIPLEERTAIANASGADLFLSVHINSARNSAGRGLETYYLSFAKNAAAEELAARENAISQATMKDLNNLVKAITTNSKIDESRDFAGLIQRYTVEGLSPSFRGVLDRGVHTAPFYVLIGANMPSILTEVGFISNPEEERWLKSDEYQQKLAESLLAGVRSYLGQLNRTQATRLGDRTGARVPPKGRSKK